MTVILSLFCLLLFTYSLGTSPEDGIWREYNNALKQLKARPDYDELLAEQLQLFQQYSSSRQGIQPQETFPCEPLQSDSVPVSVHMLRPADITVVGAMGDSLTAANGALAETVAESVIQNRGVSWSIGGQDSYQDGVLTIPNILKIYNPNLLGYSTGTGGRDSEFAKFNVAEPGNVAEDLPYQARLLVDRITAMPAVDFNNDWKLVTIFIGGNDLCQYCSDEERYSAKNFSKHVQEALDILYQELPRTYVNFVSIFDLTPLHEVANSEICNTIQISVCNCVRSEENRQKLTRMAGEYSRVTKELIESDRYKDSDDFTVVLQPFMQDNDIPRLDNGDPDRSYFTTDCFHFSAKMHYTVAIQLWNGMFEPVGSKKTVSPYLFNMTCPKMDEYLSTHINSNYTGGSDSTGLPDITDSPVSTTVLHTTQTSTMPQSTTSSTIQTTFTTFTLTMTTTLVSSLVFYLD